MFRSWLESKIKSNYQNIEVINKGNDYKIFDKETGGTAYVQISPYHNEKAEIEGVKLNITNWKAYPYYDNTDNEKNQYIGGGFARNVMIKLMQIAIEKNIKVLSIFAPSKYSLDVLNHYVKTGLLNPIPHTKFVLSNDYDGYYINLNKAKHFISSIQ